MILYNKIQKICESPLYSTCTFSKFNIALMKVRTTPGIL